MKAQIHRLRRVIEIRQALTSLAEAQMRETEGELRNLESASAEIDRMIQAVRAEIAQRPRFTSRDLFFYQNYFTTLESRRKFLLQSIESTRAVLEERRAGWIQARRDQKMVEKLQERRLQEMERENDVAAQKSADEAYIARIVRERLTS